MGNPMRVISSHHPDFPVSCSLRIQMAHLGTQVSKTYIVTKKDFFINIISAPYAAITKMVSMDAKSKKSSLFVFDLKSRHFLNAVK